MRKTFAALLVLTLLLPEAWLLQSHTVLLAQPNAPKAAVAPSSSQTLDTQEPQIVRLQSRARRRSYEGETHRHRHSGISKKEVAFMAAIAGTSMGIGALAGGAKGLAIGAIVGGWGAYAGHRLWKRLR